MSLPLPPPAYSAEDQAQTRAQITRQLAAQQAQIQTLAADAGDATVSYPKWDLRYYAAQAGITLGQGNDQPAFDAAHAAMAAKPLNEMLYVWTPPGIFMIDQVLIYSSSGFYCDAGSSMLRQKPQTTPKPVVQFAVLDDTADNGSTAAAWMLWGFKIDGQYVLNWTDPGGVDETHPGLFHYATTITNPGDPDLHATVGQAGVYLRGAWADAAYGTSGGNTTTIDQNSPFFTGAGQGDGDAKYRVGELEISNCAGDGFFLSGTGAGLVGSIRVGACGGRGIVLNAYDNTYGPFDVGDTGFEGIVLNPLCSDVRFMPCKAYFTGMRANAGDTGAGGQAQDAGHQVGMWFNTCGNVQAMSMEVQDSVGSAYRIDSCDTLQAVLRANWVGLPPAQQTKPLGGIDFGLGTDGFNAIQAGQILFSMNPPLDPAYPDVPTVLYPQIKYAVNAKAPLMSSLVHIGTQNLPTTPQGNATIDVVDPAWMISSACTQSFPVVPLVYPTAGETLILNGVTITFVTQPTTMDQVVSVINAANVPNLTCFNHDEALVLQLGPGSGVNGVLTLAGTAITALGLAPYGGTVNGASNYDRSVVMFNSAIRSPQQWLASSGTGAGIGVYVNGTTNGAAGFGNGNAWLLASGRYAQAQIAIYDEADGYRFKFPMVAQLDSSGDMQIGFFSQAVAPINQPTALGSTWVPNAGSGVELRVDSSTNGGTGTTYYTFTDLIYAMKMLGLIAQ